MGKRVLKLYVAGRTGRSERAVANLKRINEEELGGEFEIAIIDVLENPRLARNEKIIATPTLIRELPPPIRRIIGDLSNSENVLLGLDLVSVNESTDKGSE